MSYSSKEVADLFSKVRSDLQRTETMLGADRQSNAKGGRRGEDNSKGGDDVASLRVITAQQATLHFQREVVKTFKTVVGKMGGSDEKRAVNVDETLAAATFVQQSETSSSSGPIGNVLRFRLTKGLLKAMSMPISVPANTEVASTSKNTGRSSMLSTSSGVTAPQDTGVLTTKLEPRTIRSALIAILTVPSRGGHAAGPHHTADESPLDDNTLSGNLQEFYRGLSSVELASTVSHLWNRTFTKMIRGLFFIDLYAGLLHQFDVGRNFNRQQVPAELAANFHSLLSSEGCANQLKAIHDSIYLESTSTSENSQKGAVRAYLPELFNNLVEGSFWEALEESVQAISSDDSEFDVITSLDWFFQLQAVRSLHPMLMTMMLVGGGGGSNSADRSGSGSLTRYRAHILEPLISAAKWVGAALLSAEIPMSYSASSRQATSKDSNASILTCAELFADALARVLTAHTSESESHIEGVSDAEPYLRQELVVPVISALRECLEAHRARTKVFGLPRELTEAIEAANDSHELDDNAESVQNAISLELQLPSRRLVAHLYQPLKAQFTSQCTRFSQFHSETIFTFSYQLVTMASALADEEEIIFVARSRKISLGTAIGPDDAKSCDNDGGRRGPIAASHEEVRTAIRKAFERRSHLIDRSAHDGVGGGEHSGGIVYKWNKDVFVTVCGELGLQLAPLGKRPLEVGGQDLYKVSIPAIDSNTSSAAGVRNYQVYVEKGLLMCRPIASEAAPLTKAAGPSLPKNGLLLGAKQKPKTLLGTAVKATVEQNTSFSVVDKFEAFFCGV